MQVDTFNGTRVVQIAPAPPTDPVSAPDAAYFDENQGKLVPLTRLTAAHNPVDLGSWESIRANRAMATYLDALVAMDDEDYPKCFTVEAALYMSQHPPATPFYTRALSAYVIVKRRHAGRFMLPLIREHLSVDEYRAFLKTARRNARRRSATIASHQVPSPAEMGQ